jgi:hypothetical protein
MYHLAENIVLIVNAEYSVGKVMKTGTRVRYDLLIIPGILYWRFAHGEKQWSFQAEAIGRVFQVCGLRMRKTRRHIRQEHSFERC